MTDTGQPNTPTLGYVGPLIPGEIWEQLTTFGGGCDLEVGPAPEQVGDFPVPVAPGECGDVQLYVFS